MRDMGKLVDGWCDGVLAAKVVSGGPASKGAYPPSLALSYPVRYMIYLRGAGPAASRGATKDMDSQSNMTLQPRVQVRDGMAFIVAAQTLIVAH